MVRLTSWENNSRGGVFSKRTAHSTSRIPMRILKIMILAACSAAPLLADVMDTEPGVTVSTAASKDELAWHTNYDEGLSLSKKSGKMMFVLFTGSDWCRWCIN